MEGSPILDSSDTGLNVLTEHQRAVLWSVKQKLADCLPEDQQRIQSQLQLLSKQVADLQIIQKTQKSLTLQLALRQRSSSLQLPEPDPNSKPSSSALKQAESEAAPLSNDVENTLQGVFAISDLAFKDELHALAHHLGCTEEQVKDFFSKMKSNVRTLMQRLQKKSPAPASEVGGEGVLEDSSEPGPANSNGGPAVDAQAQLDKLKRLVDDNGGISQAHSTGALIMQMQQACSYAVKSAQLHAMLNTKSNNVLLRLVSSKLLNTLNSWLLAAHEDKQNTFLKLLLMALEHLPIALPVLQDSGLRESITVLCKHNRESVASAAASLLLHWQHQESGRDAQHPADWGDKSLKPNKAAAIGTSKIALLQTMGSKSRSTGIHINKGRPLSTDDIKRAKLKAARQRSAAQAGLGDTQAGPLKQQRLHPAGAATAGKAEATAALVSALVRTHSDSTPRAQALAPVRHNTPDLQPKNSPHPSSHTNPNVSSPDPKTSRLSQSHASPSWLCTPTARRDRDWQRDRNSHDSPSHPSSPLRSRNRSSDAGKVSSLARESSHLSSSLPAHEPDLARLSSLSKLDLEVPPTPVEDSVPGVIIQPPPLPLPMDGERRIQLATAQHPVMGTALRSFYDKAWKLKKLREQRISQHVERVACSCRNLAGMKSNVRWPMQGVLRLQAAQHVAQGEESHEHAELQARLGLNPPRRSRDVPDDPQEPPVADSGTCAESQEAVRQLLFVPSEQSEVAEQNRKMWAAGIRLPDFVTVPKAPVPSQAPAKATSNAQQQLAATPAAIQQASLPQPQPTPALQPIPQPGPQLSPQPGPQPIPQPTCIAQHSTQPISVPQRPMQTASTHHYPSQPTPASQSAAAPHAGILRIVQQPTSQAQSQFQGPAPNAATTPGPNPAATPCSTPAANPTRPATHPAPKGTQGTDLDAAFKAMKLLQALKGSLGSALSGQLQAQPSQQLQHQQSGQLQPHSSQQLPHQASGQLQSQSSQQLTSQQSGQLLSQPSQSAGSAATPNINLASFVQQSQQQQQQQPLPLHPQFRSQQQQPGNSQFQLSPQQQQQQQAVDTQYQLQPQPQPQPQFQVQQLPQHYPQQPYQQSMLAPQQHFLPGALQVPLLQQRQQAALQGYATLPTLRFNPQQQQQQPVLQAYVQAGHMATVPQAVGILGQQQQQQQAPASINFGVAPVNQLGHMRAQQQQPQQQQQQGTYYWG